MHLAPNTIAQDISANYNTPPSSSSCHFSLLVSLPNARRTLFCRHWTTTSHLQPLTKVLSTRHPGPSGTFASCSVVALSGCIQSFFLFRRAIGDPVVLRSNPGHGIPGLCSVQAGNNSPFTILNPVMDFAPLKPSSLQYYTIRHISIALPSEVASRHHVSSDGICGHLHHMRRS